MGLERLSLLIMDDVVEANHRATDEAWRAMHRRADAMPMPAATPEAGLATALAEAVGSFVRRLTSAAVPTPGVTPVAPQPRVHGES